MDLDPGIEAGSTGRPSNNDQTAKCWGFSVLNRTCCVEKSRQEIRFCTLPSGSSSCPSSGRHQVVTLGHHQVGISAHSWESAKTLIHIVQTGPSVEHRPLAASEIRHQTRRTPKLGVSRCRDSPGVQEARRSIRESLERNRQRSSMCRSCRRTIKLPTQTAIL